MEVVLADAFAPAVHEIAALFRAQRVEADGALGVLLCLLPRIRISNIRFCTTSTILPNNVYNNTHGKEYRSTPFNNVNVVRKVALSLHRGRALVREAVLMLHVDPNLAGLFGFSVLGL